MIFDYFYPNAWSSEMVLEIIDAVLFLLFGIAVLYLLIFAVKSVGKQKTVYPPAKRKYKFITVFPAYMEDRVIVNSVKSFLEQSYPRDKFDVLVVSDRMKDSTNKQLEELGAMVIKRNFENSTKTKALQEAVKYIDLNKMEYDYIVILDADNWVDEYFLDKMNDAFYSGCAAIQTHRVSKNYNTNIALLDSVSEEINNSIFRKGHTRLGFSSGLIGSGMAFEYDLFKKFILKSGQIGVDKQLEMYLLKSGYYIEYLADVYTYDEKVSKSRQFYKQRRRWISTQIHNFFYGVWGCPKAAMEGNWDYCNKLFQWSMPPRIILLGFILIIALGFTLAGSPLAIKWWGLLAAMGLVFILAIPDYLFNGKLIRAFASIPLLFIMMVINSFIAFFSRNKKFIHTEHYED